MAPLATSLSSHHRHLLYCEVYFHTMVRFRRIVPRLETQSIMREGSIVVLQKAHGSTSTRQTGMVPPIINSDIGTKPFYSQHRITRLSAGEFAVKPALMTSYPASSPPPCPVPSDHTFGLAGTPICACNSPSCIASSSKTAMKDSLSGLDRSRSPIAMHRPPSTRRSEGTMHTWANNTVSCPISTQPTAGEVEATRPRSGSVSPLPSPFLARDHDSPASPIRRGSMCSSAPMHTLRSSKRQPGIRDNAMSLKKPANSTSQYTQTPTAPEDPQLSRRTQKIPLPSSHVDVHVRGPSSPGAKSTSKKTATEKEKKRASPVVQISTKRKCDVSDTESYNESSDSDAPLLKCPRRYMRGTTIAKRKPAPKIQASSSPSLVAAKKRPAGRLLTDTRLRKRQVVEEKEEDKAENSDYERGEMGSLDVVRRWLKKKGYWHSAPENVKLALV